MEQENDIVDEDGVQPAFLQIEENMPEDLKNAIKFYNKTHNIDELLAESDDFDDDDDDDDGDDSEIIEEESEDNSEEIGDLF